MQIGIMSPPASAFLAACCGISGRILILFEIPSLGIEDSPELAPESFNSSASSARTGDGTQGPRKRGIPGRSAAGRLILLLLLAVALTCGCVPSSTIARMEGFDAQWRGFEALPPDPTLHHEKEITVKVIVMGNPDALHRGVVANYSHPDGVIRIRGKRINGKIVVCPACIGHEFMHALHLQDGNFVDPDELEKYGY